MQDLHIVVRDAPVPEFVRDACVEAAASLDQHYDRITSCRVTISEPHRRQQTGNRHEITVSLLVPGAEIVQSHEDEDPRVAIREAFDAARRRLDDHVAQLSEKAGGPPPQLHGRMLRLRPELDFGFLEAPDGREFFVHRDEVRGARLEDLQPGTIVHFRPDEETRDPEKVPVARGVRPAPAGERLDVLPPP